MILQQPMQGRADRPVRLLRIRFVFISVYSRLAFGRPQLENFIFLRLPLCFLPQVA